jgi:Kef-type K+ transport system membrane component KefB
LSSLLLLLVGARLLGALAARLGQPALIGELLAGAVLGPAVLGWVQVNPALSGVADLSMFFIVLGAGLELDHAHVFKGFKGSALWTVLLGFLVPFAGGLALGAAFRLDPLRVLFLGLCISITALPVAVRILSRFKLLDSMIARLTLSSAVVGDILAITTLGVIMSLPPERDLSSTLLATGQATLRLALLAALIGVAFWGIGRLQRKRQVERGLDWVSAQLGPELIFGLTCLFVMAFSSASESLGFHAVVGTFFGSMLLSHEVLGARHYQVVDHTLKAVSEGFLSPVFFALLGLHFSWDAVSDPGLLLAVLAVAIATKVLAGWLGGRLAGLGQREAWGLGAMLNGRGVMELVVAQIAFKQGFIGARLFSILVLMACVTTLLSPMLYQLFTGKRAKR